MGTGMGTARRAVRMGTAHRCPQRQAEILQSWARAGGPVTPLGWAKALRAERAQCLEPGRARAKAQARATGRVRHMHPGRVRDLAAAQGGAAGRRCPVMGRGPRGLVLAEASALVRGDWGTLPGRGSVARWQVPARQQPGPFQQSQGRGLR